MKLFNYVIIKRKDYEYLEKTALEAQVEVINTSIEKSILRLKISLLDSKIKQLAKQPKRDEKGKFSKKTNADVPHTDN